jgi:hypothetical protein
MRECLGVSRGSGRNVRPHGRGPLRTPAVTDRTPAPQPPPPSWSERYGERHKQHRITEFPKGVKGPQKVRLYARRDHFVLQWWDPVAKATRSDRVDGDLVAAIARARQVEQRLAEFKTAGAAPRRRLGHAELVGLFLEDLGRRADAGEVSPGTVGRYRSALWHYLAHCAEPAVARAYPAAARVDRAFRLGLAAFLAGRQVAANGRARAATKPMRGAGFVLDAARALFAWAADPARGGLIGEGFANPFLRPAGTRSGPAPDPLAAPDVTLPMALDLVAACDGYALRLLGPLLLFGLRAAEPRFLFAEHLGGGWLRVPCVPELDVLTKGRRDKRFPLVEELRPFWDFLAAEKTTGLLLERRKVVAGQKVAPLRGLPLAELVAEYRRRRAAAGSLTAAGRLKVRDAVLRNAGGLDYDHIQGEFAALARRLGWPRAATLKDLRHLFATAMNDAAMPEPYRRYLLGHAPVKGAVTAYTHLDQLGRHYAEALRREWSPLVEVLNRRATELSRGENRA